MTEFNKGDRVRYTGNLTPSLTGKTGTVQGNARGWIIVRFDEGLEEYPCANYSLTLIGSAIELTADERTLLVNALDFYDSERLDHIPGLRELRAKLA